MPRKVEYTVLDLIESAVRTVKTTPLNLGGVSGADGGVGGPPGGYIGQLLQTKVTYDSTEAAYSGVALSGLSLLDNLAHIRYRLNILESGGSITVVDDNDIIDYLDTTSIHFSGAGVSVVDLGNGEVQVIVTATGSGGSGTPLTVQEIDGSPVVTNVDKIIFSGAVVTDLGSGDVLVQVVGSGLDTVTGDARYLKLDTTNEPLTGPLEIYVDDARGLTYSFYWEVSDVLSNGLYLDVYDGYTAYLVSRNNNPTVQIEQFDYDGLENIDTHAVSIYRGTLGAGVDITYLESAVALYDYPDGGATFSGGAIKLVYDGVNTLIDVNPYVPPAGTMVVFDSLNAITQSGRLLSLRNQEAEKFYVTGSGLAYDIHGHLASVSHIENGFVNRWLQENTTIPSGYSLVVADYLNENGYDLTLEGDASLAIINGYSSTLRGRILLPFGVYASLSPMSADSSPYGVSLSRTVTFIKWTQSLAVATTNNGSNYWKIRLTNNAGTILKEMDTSALAADTWANLTTTTFTVPTAGASDLNLKILTVKQGTPGSLYMVGPELEVEIQ